MMSIKEHVAANRRLTILKLLTEAAGTANDSVIQIGLEAAGHVAELDRAAVRQLVRELEERDCVTVRMFEDRVMVATITERGRLAAAGRTMIDGVQSPHGG